MRSSGTDVLAGVLSSGAVHTKKARLPATSQLLGPIKVLVQSGTGILDLVIAVCGDKRKEAFCRIICQLRPFLILCS